ncbi:hypothetical protein PICMEDRAFT_34125 [Pichia membranifaciens NRRL Y-2026]|uniref:FK506-binding protein n=1 Tax=Pichia membranifaciens NRRL Y-2026 TaxID=763406 RepID=A0A1E3NJL2_9ASCO|nr:hypothetical protein PICMEDRAFT_34125 [Pichia membranifaciens NRRL Y-2026]ODQ46266.1 hypothetical protein PICMEDRAFT_34125 [Pichia membranifaciens NRRL Y-2026]
MSGLLPLASYNLELTPFSPQPCQSDDFPITVRITLASIEPEAVDEKKEPSTLRILKKTAVFEDGSDDDSSDEDEESDEECEDDDCNGCETKDGKKKQEDEEDDEDDEEDDEEDEEDLDEEGVEEHVICTLSPSTQFQQTLDLTILPDEEVFFVVTGSYTVHLTGNYVEHPNDEEEDDYVYGSDDEEDYDDGEYDLTPDEDEIIDDEIEYDLDELDNVEDIEGKIEELVEEDKKSKKREIEESEEPESKKSKKDKKAKKEKTVKFDKDLEQGPTGPAAEKESPKAKPAVKTLPGGVIVEDKTVGTGPVCKKGQKVGVRYIGKLKNGKVFDKNTSGRPFHFGLGKGEVIKGWDVGVAGMAVGGERRIVIPAPMAYGSSKLPGIPANSELTFDVKLLSIK